MWAFLKNAWQSLQANSDAIAAFISILSLLGVGSLATVIWWIANRINKQKRRIKVEALEALDAPASLLAKILTSEKDVGPVADHHIPYWQRDPGRDIQGEMKAQLLASHHLLIAAPTGYGKTREAAELAKALMAEGFHVFRVRPGVWLEEPPELLDALGGVNTRILFLFDYLNAHFRGGKQAQSRRGENEPLLHEASYHDRLLKFLEACERVCGRDEVFVLATARNEKDQWSCLDYDLGDKLWEHFGEPFKLPEPTEGVIAGLLKEVAEKTGIGIEDLDAIAAENQGAFQTAIRNLKRAFDSKEKLDKENFVPTLDGTWRQSYSNVIKEYPNARYVYDGIDLLRQMDVGLYEPLVEGAAGLVWGGNVFQREVRKFLIRRCLRQLLGENKLRTSNGVVFPYDGQIEAKDLSVEKSKYFSGLAYLVLSFGKNRDDTRDIFLSLAYSFDQNGEHQLASDMFQAIPPEQKRAYIHYNLGCLLDKQDRKVEAEAEFRAALAADPNLAPAHNSLGNLLDDKGHKEAAEAEFRAALDADPNYAAAHYNLGRGLLLDKQDRKVEAEAEFRAALDADPNLAQAHNNLGLMLYEQGHKEEAEAEFRDALAADPNLALAHYNLGLLLDKQGRKEEAEAEYQATLAADPAYVPAFKNLVTLLREKGKP